MKKTNSVPDRPGTAGYIATDSTSGWLLLDVLLLLNKKVQLQAAP